VVKPTGRRRLVGYLRNNFGISQRSACRLAPISRKAVRHHPQRLALDAALMARMKQLAEPHPRYGYLMLHELLRR